MTSIPIGAPLLVLAVSACGPAATSPADENPAQSGASPSAEEHVEAWIAGSETTLPADLVLADLPDDAVVRLGRGADFEVYWIERDGQPLVGIYLGNDPEFPAHERTEGEIEDREESAGVTTVSFTRDDAILSRERLFEAPAWRDPPIDSVNASNSQATRLTPAEMEQGRDKYGWVSAAHVFTIETRDKATSGAVTRRSATPEALAVFGSIAIAPTLRASWDARR